VRVPIGASETSLTPYLAEVRIERPAKQVQLLDGPGCRQRPSWRGPQTRQM